jgi:pilus assembly protein CpaF
MSAAVNPVEAEVRELVPRRGLDPVQDRTAVRRLVDEVIAGYDERALTPSLVPLQDPQVAARAVDDAGTGFGRLQRHLDDRPSRRSASSSDCVVGSGGSGQ